MYKGTDLLNKNLISRIERMIELTCRFQVAIIVFRLYRNSRLLRVALFVTGNSHGGVEYDDGKDHISFHSQLNL